MASVRSYINSSIRSNILCLQAKGHINVKTVMCFLYELQKVPFAYIQLVIFKNHDTALNVSARDF